MKKLLLILALVSLGNILQLNGQEIELNTLENLKNLKISDTLKIDIKKRVCFHGNWQKLVITRVNERFQLIKINDVTKLILKHDKKAVLYNEEEKWIRRNIKKVQEPKNTLTISKKEYVKTIDNLIRLIATYKNCSTDIAGQYSTIKISMNNIEEKFNFKCEIQTEL